MRIALLGVSQAAAQLLDALITLDDVHLEAVFVGAEEPMDASVCQHILDRTGLTPNRDWESLLHDDVDVVIVSPADPPTELRDDQLRKLVQAGKYVWAIHPLCPSIVAYELDMIAQEGNQPIRVYEPMLEHPAVARLAEVIELGARGPLGATETLRWERRIPQRTAQVARKQLARDALIASVLAGDIELVSGVGRQGTDGQRVLVGAALHCSRQRVVQWTNLPGPEGATVTLEGTQGALELEMPGQGPWKMRFLANAAAAETAHHSAEDAADVRPEWWSSVGAPGGESFDPEDAATRIVSAWQRRGDPAEIAAAQRRWRQALRSLEAAELAQHSAVRGKALPLHRDQVTEADAFKGVMSAWGCGLLLFTLLVLLGFSVVEGVRYSRARARWLRDRQPAAQTESLSPAARTSLWLRLWPAYPFVAFLLLQLLRVICRSGPDRSRADSVSS